MYVYVYVHTSKAIPALFNCRELSEKSQDPAPLNSEFVSQSLEEPVTVIEDESIEMVNAKPLIVQRQRWPALKCISTSMPCHVCHGDSFRSRSGRRGRRLVQPPGLSWILARQRLNWRQLFREGPCCLAPAKQPIKFVGDQINTIELTSFWSQHKYCSWYPRSLDTLSFPKIMVALGVLTSREYGGCVHFLGAGRQGSKHYTLFLLLVYL